MDVNLMRDFEELEGMNVEEDENPTTGGVVEDDEEDENFRPVNCSTLSSADIFYELEKRNIKSTGFPDTDKDLLQKAFDEEFAADLEAEKVRRKEAKRRAALQAGLQKRRMLMESTLQEEQDALAVDYQISMMLELVRENSTATAMRLDINSITARVLAKAMWANNTITCLDLSSNDLNDHAGSYLARILKRNFTLKKLELDDNNFGARTCAAFGESLRINTSLVYLSMDSNPLVLGADGVPAGMIKNVVSEEVEDYDVSGIKSLAESLRVNKTLTSLNLFRCNIPFNGGECIANAMEDNKSILFLEVGCNKVNLSDAKRIAASLDSNLANFEAAERARRADAATDAEQEAERVAAADKARKDEENKIWLQQRRDQRAEDRRADEEQKTLDAIQEAEDAAKRAEQDRKAAAIKAAEDEAKKKAKGDKKKK
jgi:hypothetical protein